MPKRKTLHGASIRMNVAIGKLSRGIQDRRFGTLYKDGTALRPSKNRVLELARAAMAAVREWLELSRD